MKVVILTLRLGANYGGILQAYALQRSIASLGHDVRTTRSKGMLARRLIKLVPGARYLAFRMKGVKYTPLRVTTKYTSLFIKRYIKTVDFDIMKFGARNGRYDAYVVGSDQVWRKPYAIVPHNLLSFVNRHKPVKISYAASFGRDDISEYDERLIAETARLARRFNALSVRESSGVAITKESWGVESIQHVDPTLLVDKKDYCKLIEDSGDVTSEPGGELFSYVLDPAEDKQSISKRVADSLGLKMFTVIEGDENRGLPMPPVEQWLRSFRDAEYIVTDSFHGMVFSIIFNKPFIAIGNEERGLARFMSLLKIFNLESRLIKSIDDIDDTMIHEKINWSVVNDRITTERARSLSYLESYLV